MCKKHICQNLSNGYMVNRLLDIFRVKSLTLFCHTRLDCLLDRVLVFAIKIHLFNILLCVIDKHLLRYKLALLD